MSREEERDEDQQISSLREWAEEATEDTAKEEASERDSQETLREEAAELKRIQEKQYFKLLHRLS